MSANKSTAEKLRELAEFKWTMRDAFVIRAAVDESRGDLINEQLAEIFAGGRWRNKEVKAAILAAADCIKEFEILYQTGMIIKGDVTTRLGKSATVLYESGLEALAKLDEVLK